MGRTRGGLERGGRRTYFTITTFVFCKNIDDLLTVVGGVQRLLRGEGRREGFTAILLVKTEDGPIRKIRPGLQRSISNSENRVKKFKTYL